MKKLLLEYWFLPKSTNIFYLQIWRIFIH